MSWFRWVRAGGVLQAPQHSSCPGLGSGPAAEANPPLEPGSFGPPAVRGTPAPPNQGQRGGRAGKDSRAASRRRDAPPRESSRPMGDRLTKLLRAAAESRALIGRGAGGASGHAAPGAIASWPDGGERGGTAGPALPRPTRSLGASRPGQPGLAHAGGGKLRDARAGRLQRRAGAPGGAAGAGRHLRGVPESGGSWPGRACAVPAGAGSGRAGSSLRRSALLARVLCVRRRVRVCVFYCLGAVQILCVFGSLGGCYGMYKG